MLATHEVAPPENGAVGSYFEPPTPTSFELASRRAKLEHANTVPVVLAGTPLASRFCSWEGLSGKRLCLFPSIRLPTARLLQRPSYRGRTRRRQATAHGLDPRHRRVSGVRTDTRRTRIKRIWLEAGIPPPSAGAVSGREGRGDRRSRHRHGYRAGANH
jgi:hypothetical protein